MNWELRIDIFIAVTSTKGEVSTISISLKFPEMPPIVGMTPNEIIDEGLPGRAYTPVKILCESLCAGVVVMAGTTAAREQKMRVPQYFLLTG